MPIVQKGNKQLTVASDNVAVYLNDGYDEIDNDGVITRSATANKNVPIGEYNKMLAEKNSEITRLQVELDNLCDKQNKKEKAE